MQVHAQELSVAIDRIYAAVVDPPLWSHVLSDVVDRAGGTQAVLLRSDIVCGEGDVVLSRYNDPDAWVPYRDYYAAINPLHNVADPVRYADGWSPTILCDEDWMPRDATEATEYYNDFLRPIDACHGLYLRLALDGRSLTTISIGRGYRQGRFDGEARAALAPLHDHLIRAATLTRRFAEVRRLADGALAAMNAASDPLMLLDGAGKLVHANGPAEKLLSDGAVIVAVDGGIAAAAHHLTTQFERALAMASGADPRRGGSLSLPSRAGRTVATMHVLPTTLESALDATGGPAVLVRVTPVEPSTRAEAVLDRFGLTPTERSLALGLSHGTSLQDIAEARGISIHTVRRHLASIFDKTGVHRQAELVSLMTRAG